jgi:phosphoenolpyruvate synthase/pyruvate phosphate dikinase
VPDVTRLLGYGDVKGTKDALLFVSNEDYTWMYVFVARGQKSNKTALYNLLADGELDEEIEELIKRALLESEL